MVEKTGRGRAPCCDKTKVKRGPWSPEEDLRLTSFIQNHGHSNWRALPKQAGLLRCGKSCRLRWVNYLTPHVKRGNFTPQEEQTVINLHSSIGNKWSKIASYLPGRTDNEIKNVWNTHLKKRLKNDRPSSSCVSSSKDDQEVQATNSPTSSYASNLTNSNDTRLVEDTIVDEIKIPLESDTDFWSLFDSLEEYSDNNGVSNINPEEKVDECSNWFRLLENELGLTSDVENDVRMTLEPEIGPGLDYFPIWPSSPQNLGI